MVDPLVLTYLNSQRPPPSAKFEQAIPGPHARLIQDVSNLAHLSCVQCTLVDLAIAPTAATATTFTITTTTITAH